MYHTPQTPSATERHAITAIRHFTIHCIVLSGIVLYYVALLLFPLICILLNLSALFWPTACKLNFFLCFCHAAPCVRLPVAYFDRTVSDHQQHQHPFSCFAKFPPHSPCNAWACPRAKNCPSQFCKFLVESISFYKANMNSCLHFLPPQSPWYSIW